MTYPGTSFGDPGTAQRTATVTLNADVSGYANQMGAAAQQTNQFSGSVDKLQSKLGHLHSWAGHKLLSFAERDFAVLGVATADAATFEKQLSTLSATAAVTGQSMGGIKGGIESAFTKFPVARGDIVALTEALTNMGVTGEGQVASLTRTFLKLGAATGENSVGLAQGMTQLSRLMGVTDATQIGNMANSLLTVSKTAGVSASGVLDFAQAIAPMARQAGIGQAAVLGISTAFTKAGADGYVAANTFNSIIQDISELSKTGSPEIAKYANLIGVTAEKFKKMPGQQQITQVLAAVGKGGPASTAFVQEQGYGVRAQSAIAAVTQSGDLQRQIDIATGAQGNQKNLNAGAGAAWNNLADKLAHVRNEFTQLGTVIGTTFLKPLEAGVSGVGMFASALNSMIKPFSTIIGLAAGGAGVVAGLGGVAMNAAGLIGTVALARMVTRGTHVASLGGGLRIGRSGIASQEDQMLADRMLPGGGASWLQRRMYNAGLGVARIAGPAGTGEQVGDLRRLSTWRNLGVAAPFRAIQALNAGQAQMLRESTRSSWDRLRFRDEQPRISLGDRFNRMVAQTANRPVMNVVGDEANRTARSLGNLTGATVNAGASQFGPIAGRLLRYGGPRLATSLIAGFAGVPLGGMIANQARTGAGGGDLRGATRQLSDAGIRMGAAMRHPIRSFGELTKAGAATSVALKDLTIKATAAGLGTAAGLAGQGIARGASLAWQGTKMAAGAAFSLPGMLAISGGMLLHSRNSEAQNAGNVDKFLNPIQKYNNMLGTTTTNLANFNNELLNGANGAAKKFSSFAEAGQVTTGDQAAAPKNPKNKFWGDLRNHAPKGHHIDTYAEALSSLQISDPSQLYAIKEDMLSAGIEPGAVRKAIGQYLKAGNPDPFSGLGDTRHLERLGKAIANTEGLGMDWGSQSKSTSGGHIMGLMMSGIDAQRVTDEQRIGAPYARQKALGSYVTGLTPLMRKLRNSFSGEDVDDAPRKAMADALHQITGGSEDTYNDYLSKNTNDFVGTDTASLQKYMIKALGATKQGKTYLNALKVNGTIDPTEFNQKLIDLQNTPDGSSFNGLLRKNGGQLGAFAAGDSTIQQAIGLQQGNAGAQDAAVNKLVDQATLMSGGLAGAGGALETFKSAIGDTNSALYKEAMAAQQRVSEKLAYQTPFQTRGVNFGRAVEAYKDAQKTYDAMPTNKRPAWDDYVKPKKDAYESGLADQQQYLQSMYQTAQSYGVQMVRAAEDEGIQVKRAKRNFGIQMLQAQQDYQRQSLRSTEDFNLQTSRANADHATQLKNQAATEAQSIYDPFARIQSKYVIDAGTLSQNLGDQNAALARQQADLRRLKKRGLSEQAIQTMNLADPNNAQQADELANNMTAAQARRINRQAGTRAGLTQQLTQNPDNLAFQQSERDFHRQMDRSREDFHRTMERAGQDYDTSVSRAEKQQAISMSDMADDYNRTVKRAGEDLTTAMTEVTGNFGSMYEKTMAQIANSVEKYSPKAAAQMRKDLKSLTDANPWLKDGDASSYDPSVTVIHSPNVLGINPDGKIGSYDSKGHFHPNATGYPGGNPPHIAAPVQPKHTAGGHSATGTAGGVHQTYAEGGISVGPQLAWVSEWAQNAAEAHIPLNDRGASFMSDVISKALIQKMHTHGHGMMPSGSNSHYEIHEDHSTRFSGDMHIAAADLSDLIRQLVAKQRLSKLSSPSRR